MMEPTETPVLPCFEPDPGANDSESVLAPLEEAEAHARLIGKFVDWVEALFMFRDRISELEKRPCSYWLDLLDSMAERFLPAPGDDPGSLALRQTLAGLRVRLEAFSLDTMETTWNLAAILAEECMEGEPSSEVFCRGYVTFCRFQPMRGIPAKIVAMVGMNDGEFPRPERRLGFDLMDRRFLCDRTRSDDDRYAFLEALLSVRQRLFISYTGRRDTDRQELPPSILVEELVSYIRTRFVPASGKRIEDFLLVRHPLHPFSRDYFIGTSLPRSPSGRWHGIATTLQSPAAPHPEADREPEVSRLGAGSTDGTVRVDLGDLIRFFESPAKYYYERVVGVDLDPNEAELPDDLEPESLDSFQQYAISRMIGRMREIRPLGWETLQDDLYLRLRAEGVLAVGEKGFRDFTSCWESAKVWLDNVQEQEASVGGPIPPLKDEIPLLIGNDMVTLVCALDNLRTNGQLVMSPAKLKAKYRLRLAVRHAALDVLRKRSECALPPISVFVGSGNKDVFAMSGLPDSNAYLLNLVELFLRGGRGPLCFWPNAAESAILNKPEFDERAARNAWNPAPFASPWEKPDSYTRLAFGERMPEDGVHFETFKECTTKVFGFLAAKPTDMGDMRQ